MKKILLPILIFIAGFVLTYLVLCYGIPGWRIKLYAEPMEYFNASIRHMVSLKAIISAIVGLLLAGITAMIQAKKSK